MLNLNIRIYLMIYLNFLNNLIDLALMDFFFKKKMKKTLINFFYLKN